MLHNDNSSLNGRFISNQVVVGLALLVLGIGLLLANLGWVDFAVLARWIPLFFVGVGIWQLIANRFRFITGPLILVVGGILVQLSIFDVIALGSVLDLWPLLLIIIGGSMLLERTGVKLPQPFTHDEDVVSILSIFNGPEHSVTSPAFQGGEATAVFGGIDLDLRRTAVAAPPAQINAFALFGGIDIFVPAGWQVETDVIGIFGGTDDERTHKLAEPGTPATLVVTGFAMFGGITLKN